MNKFNEFDLIKTPRNWIDEVTATNFEPTKRAKVIRIKYIFAIVLIVMTIGISSLGITYAFSDSFRTWLSQRFSSNLKISSALEFSSINKNTPTLKLDYGHWRAENEFFGIIDEDYNFLKVFTLENEQIRQCPINEYYGSIAGHEFSFKYADYQERIVAFDFNGCVYSVLPKIINNDIYVCVDINDGEQRALNIAKINLESKQISFITNDNISVNPITSPQQTNILINKSDQGWENYNIETGETNLIKNIDPYMHSNCITFIDEQTVVTYDENGHSYLINILTNEVRTLDKYPLEGTIVNIEYSDETIKLTNIITGAVSRIDYHFYGTNYMGTYCSIDYLVLFNNEKLYLYDIESNQLVDLDPQKELDEQLKEVMIIDQKHLLITTDKRAYIVANVGNNG